MEVYLQPKNLDLTPSFEEYVHEKLDPLGDMLTSLDLEGSAKLFVEVERMSNHHKKGDVYKASANLDIPHKSFRVEHEDVDARAAIDNLKHKLHNALERHKDFLESQRRRG